MSADPAAQAHAFVERLFALLVECRTVVRELEPGPEGHESASADAARPYY